MKWRDEERKVEIWISDSHPLVVVVLQREVHLEQLLVRVGDDYYVWEMQLGLWSIEILGAHNVEKIFFGQVSNVVGACSELYGTWLV